MKTYLSIIAIAFSTVFSQTSIPPSSTVWIDTANGNKYDFSSLKKDPSDPWKVKDKSKTGLFSMIYYFNFGANHVHKCKGQEIAVSEVLEVIDQPTDTCEVLGRADAMTVGLLDDKDPKKGIYIQYGNGEKCVNGDNPALQGKPRQSRFNIHCSSSQDEFVVDLPGGTQGTTKCVLDFKISSPAGCPIGSLSILRSTVILFWIIVIISVYLCCGTMYNIRHNNLWGKDAIPNIEFWRIFPTLVQDGIAYTLNLCTVCKNSIKGKFSGGTSSYSEI